MAMNTVQPVGLGLQTPTRLRNDGIPLRDMWELEKEL
jgi:hypothetical protein